MNNIRVMPCLLLKGLGLVKTIKFKEHNYIGDPINAVHIFNKKEVDELIFLDITASKEGRKPPLELIMKIADECFMPFAIGGGINSLKDMKTLLKAGAEKVIVNTAAYEKPDFIKEASETFGSQSLVVSIDVKKNFFGKYDCYVKNGTKKIQKNPVEFAKEVQKLGCGEILLNSIDNDGVMSGYDLDLIKQVSKAVNVPVITCGGAGRLEHFKEAVNSGASALAAGSMFVYHGPRKAVLINFPDRKELDNLFIDLNK